MSSYIAKDTLHPRVFILACNVESLVVQSTLEESKIVLLNRLAAIQESIYPQTAISFCNEQLYFYKNSNVLAYYDEIQGRASHVVDRTIANQYLLEIPTSSNIAGLSYSNQTLQFFVPSSSVPIVSATYLSEARLGIGIQTPLHALHVIGNVLATGTLTTSNLVVLGDSVILDTVTSNTEQMIITNLGSGPALKVTQRGDQPVATFYDDDTLSLIVADGGWVGIRTDIPRQTLDVEGQMYVACNVGIGTTIPRQRLDVQGDAIVLGNIGIGTTLPQSPLDVYGTIHLQGSLIQNGNEVIFTNVVNSWQFNPSNSNLYYSNGNVGIGTSSAVSKLDIRGDTQVMGNLNVTCNVIAPFLKGTASNLQYGLSTSGYLQGSFYDGSAAQTWLVRASPEVNANDLVARDLNSNIYVAGIGIGTTMARYVIDAQGSMYLSGNLGIGTESFPSRLSIHPTRYEPKITLWNSNSLSHYGLGISSNQFNYHTLGDHVFYHQGSNGNGNELLRLQSSGNLGIGTSLPIQRLDVRGSTYIQTSLGIGTTLPQYTLDVLGSITTNNNNLYLGTGTLYASNLVGSVTQVGHSLYANGFLIGESFNGSIDKTWSIQGSSNNQPNFLVARDNNSNIYISGVGIGTTIARQSVDTTGSVILQGSLGIGMTNPTANLHIGTATPLIKLEGTTNGNLININDASYLRFGSDQSYKTHILVVGDSFTSAPGRMNFRYKNYIGFDVVNGISGTGIEQVRLDTQGNVGIGTIAPQEKLDIQGKLRISNQIQSTLTTGTSPFSIQSISLVSNLNVEFLQGESKSYYRNINNINNGTLSVLYGGMGCNSLPLNKLLVGNGIQSIQTPWELHWNGSNLGIGTDQPRQRLDILGSVLTSGNLGIGTYLSRSTLDIEGDLRITQPITSVLSNGTSPLNISSTTLVSNLNVQYLDSHDGSFYRNVDNMTTGTMFVSRGGTGCNILPSYKLLVGNGANSLTTPWELHWQYGNLGIGTAEPKNTLDVEGSIQTSQRFISTLLNSAPLSVQSVSLVSNLNVQYLNGNDSDYYTNVNNVQTGVLSVSHGGTGSNQLTSQKLLVGQGTSGVQSPWELHWSGSKLGLGTSNPSQLLDVQGNVYVSSNIGIQVTHPQAALDVGGSIYTQSLRVNTFTTVNNYGNLGIGTLNPMYPIHVDSGDSVFTVSQGKLGIFKAAAAASTDLEIRNGISGDYTGILVHNQGNVYPGASIRVQNTRYDQSSNMAYAAHMGLLRFNNNAYLQSGLPLGFLHFGGNHTGPSSTNRAYSAAIGAVSEEAFVTSSNMGTALVFYTGSNAYQTHDTSVSFNERMRLNREGNLGIGTTNPQYSLDVHGTFQSGSGLQGASTTYQGGPFYRQRRWDGSNQSHVISFPDYCITTNSCGTLSIQVKSLSAPYKLGNVSASFLVPESGSVDLFNVFYHQNTALTQLLVSMSNLDIHITTDVECAIAWTSIGAC